MSLEEEYLQLIYNIEEDIEKINLSKSNEYIINNRNQLIHVRSYLPENPKSLIISLHGYAAHSNRPVFRLYGREFVNQNYGFITLDFHGHGYSEGEKALITNYNHLLDDVISLLGILYSNDNSKQFQLNRVGFECPFIISGQSMGGGVAILLSKQLMKYKQLDFTNKFNFSDGILNVLGRNFHGSVLVCPAINLNVPAQPVRFILENLIVPLFPTSNVPDFLSKPIDGRHTWKNESIRKYGMADKYPDNLQALGYGKTIMFATGASMVAMTETIRNSFNEINFPFIILHDPDDQIVSSSGTIALVKDSSTSDSDKEFIPLPGSLHDLYNNEPTAVFQNTIKFLNKLNI